MLVNVNFLTTAFSLSLWENNLNNSSDQVLSKVKATRSLRSFEVDLSTSTFQDLKDTEIKSLARNSSDPPQNIPQVSPKAPAKSSPVPRDIGSPRSAFPNLFTKKTSLPDLPKSLPNSIKAAMNNLNDNFSESLLKLTRFVKVRETMDGQNALKGASLTRQAARRHLSNQSSNTEKPVSTMVKIFRNLSYYNNRLLLTGFKGHGKKVGHAGHGKKAGHAGHAGHENKVGHAGHAGHVNKVGHAGHAGHKALPGLAGHRALPGFPGLAGHRALPGFPGLAGHRALPGFPGHGALAPQADVKPGRTKEEVTPALDDIPSNLDDLTTGYNDESPEEIQTTQGKKKCPVKPIINPRVLIFTDEGKYNSYKLGKSIAGVKVTRRQKAYLEKVNKYNLSFWNKRWVPFFNKYNELQEKCAEIEEYGQTPNPPISLVVLLLLKVNNGKKIFTSARIISNLITYHELKKHKFRFSTMTEASNQQYREKIGLPRSTKSSNEPLSYLDPKFSLTKKLNVFYKPLII